SPSSPTDVRALRIAASSFCVGWGRRGQHPFPTRRSSDLSIPTSSLCLTSRSATGSSPARRSLRSSTDAHRNPHDPRRDGRVDRRSEEHTSELQSRENLVCRLLLEKKKRRLAPCTTAVAPA